MDYFNFNDSSSDEDISNLCKNDSSLLEKANEITAPNAKILTAERKRKLTTEVSHDLKRRNHLDTSSTRNDKTEVMSCCHDRSAPSSGNSEFTVKPFSHFWLDDDELTDWKTSSKIWSNANTSKMSVHTCHNSNMTNSTPERNDEQSLNKVTEKQLVQQSQTRRLHRNIFATNAIINHHLTGHKSKSFAYPKTKRADNDCALGVINRIKWSSPQYSHLLATANASASITVWNYSDHKLVCVQTLSQHKAVRDITWTKCGKLILGCGYDRKAILTDVETGKAITEAVHADFVTCCKFHPIDHNYFVTGSSEALFCWDKRNTCRAAQTFRYKDRFGQVQDVIFNRNGSELFSCNDLVSRDSSDRNIMAWDYRKGVALSNQIYQERFTCTRLKLHPDGQQFYAQSQGNYIAVFSTIRPYKMNKFKRYESHKVDGYSMGFDISPNAQFLVSASADGKVTVYDVQRTKRIQQLIMGTNVVCNDVAWHPVLPATIAVSTWDGRLSVWD